MIEQASAFSANRPHVWMITTLLGRVQRVVYRRENSLWNRYSPLPDCGSIVVDLLILGYPSSLVSWLRTHAPLLPSGFPARLSTLTCFRSVSSKKPISESPPQSRPYN